MRQIPAGFAISKRGASAVGPSEGNSPDPEAAARLMGEAMKRYLKENFEDVGAKFTNEALKMHYGVSETRNIRGVSTPEEEKVLKEEGVDFFKVGPPPDQGQDYPDSGGDDDD